MKKFKKSTRICLTLFLYVTAMAIYLVPRNHGVSDLEKYLTVAGSYVVVAILWWVLRKKEKFVAQRRNDEGNKMS